MPTGTNPAYICPKAIFTAKIKAMKIGVFDSGIGGKAVALELSREFPDAQVLCVDDSQHVPYGLRPNDEVIELTDNAVQPLLRAHCDVIVLACNTATAAAIETLRGRYPHTPFVGLEPMVKTAAGLTKTGTIAICATPSTLASKRYQRLKNHYAKNISVLEPDCGNWAYMIERGESDKIQLRHTIMQLLDARADVIVLGCTHYHWIKEELQTLAANRAIVIEPSRAIARRISTLLELKKPTAVAAQRR